VTIEATKERRRRRRMPSISEAIRQAEKAGKTVVAYTVSDDGVSLTFAGGTEAKPFGNPWDEVLQRDAH
jgi:hypothetical protein